MMDWLLILTVFSGPLAEEVPVGQLANEQICGLAGASMAQVLVAANPGIRVTWRCAKRVAI